MDARIIRNEIERLEKLPTIPPVLTKLLDIIENPRTSLSEIGNFISKDPALASVILKAINSPVYGFPGRISTVSQALILLGLNVVKGMLLSIAVFEIMQKVMAGLREHSVGCAITARIISRRKALDCFEEVAIAALLHDLGKVVLGLKFSDEYQKIISESTEKHSFIFDTEKARFGVDHADVGTWLLEKWQFPRSLIEAIDYHHQPQLSRNFPVQTAIVHLSDVLIRAKGFGFAGDNFVPAINPQAWRTLKLTETDLKGILDEMEDSLQHADDILIIDMEDS